MRGGETVLLTENLLFIVGDMEKRRNILKGGIFIMSAFLVSGLAVWIYVYQSGSWVRESSEIAELGEKRGTGSVTDEEFDTQMDTHREELAVTQTDQSKERVETQPSDFARVAPANDVQGNTKDTQSEKQSGLLGSRKQLVDFGFEKSARKAQDIDTVVLHSSFNNQGGDRYSVEKVISIWERYGVAPHFVIDRKGNIVQLVSEHDIAYHAGVSEMKDGRKNVNDFSLGVEILNAEDDTYTEAQYTAVNNLVAHLKKTYPIKHVVGHDDIAPGRKTDPWNFDWKKLE